MRYCNQCGTNVNFDARFCQNCGAALEFSINKTIDANLKVDITNKTTEKILNNVSSSLTSSATGFKKIINSLLRILWRFIIVAAVIGIIGFGIFHIYENNEKEIAEKEQKEKNEDAARDKQSKIENAKSRNKKWTTYSQLDPASKKNVRGASITSEDGLCELTVQKRIEGTELTGLQCIEIKINEFDDIIIKFDQNEISSRMRIESYSDSDDVYIPSYQFTIQGHMSYEKFISGLLSNNAVAFKVPSKADSFWASFSLEGSSEAINKLGKPVQ